MNPFARLRCYVWLAFALVVVAAAFCLDAPVQKWMLQHQTRGGLAFMRQVSRWGDWPAHVAVGMIGAGAAHFLKSRRWLVIFVAMILSCALAGSIGPLIKSATGRARPSAKMSVGWIGPTWSQKRHSFPSGHTTASTAFFGALCLARRKIGFPLLAVPATVAASRLYLNAHYFSDVVCGTILGFGCAMLVWRLLKARGFPLFGSIE